jgi:hypothetical protein
MAERDETVVKSRDGGCAVGEVLQRPSSLEGTGLRE